MKKCPLCGNHYINEITECPNCHLELVEEQHETTPTSTSLAPTNTQRKNDIPHILGMCASVVAAFGILLPFACIGPISVSLLKYNKDNTAIYCILIAAIAFVFSYIENDTGMIFSGILLSYYPFYAFNKMTLSGDAGIVSGILSKDMGFYCILLGGIVLIGSGVVIFITKLIRNKNN